MYIVYAHEYKYPEDGSGLELSPIGIARNKKEINTIISNFRKEVHEKKHYMFYHKNNNNKVKCSSEKFENKYLK